MTELPPHVLHALMDAGWDASMIVCAYDALWRIARRVMPLTATASPPAAQPRPQRSERPLTRAERTARWRAKKLAAASDASDARVTASDEISSLASLADRKNPEESTQAPEASDASDVTRRHSERHSPSLANVHTLSKSLDSKRESDGPSDASDEISSLAVTRHSAKRTPLPATWLPDGETTDFALERLGGGDAADRCFAKFRIHHETSGEEWTPRQWQSRARGWVVKEEQFFGRQRSLPLMRSMPAPAPAPAAEVDPVFKPVFNRLAASIGADLAWAWFAGGQIAIDGGTATVTAPSRMVALRIEASFGGPLERAVGAEYPAVRRVVVAVRPPGKLPEAPGRVTGPPAETSDMAEAG